MHKFTKSSFIAAMVVSALRIAGDDVPGKEGVTLAKIKSFISETYNLEMTKPNITIIKKFLNREFQSGRIVMTNYDGDRINYTKRFSVNEAAVMAQRD
ncbi:hypothetical protein Bhyg_05828 [Pseudolycoriella hygida]|uniref:H15 domain-containing protein n=1 Tax=Pseudolycoriella hygida TaxID=35572 RepID=A0A9Q0MZM5_9DIPT|nr:hypothetical protein Bhyg_05828 [Pseudolycoriella hygida]